MICFDGFTHCDVQAFANQWQWLIPLIGLNPLHWISIDIFFFDVTYVNKLVAIDSTFYKCTRSHKAYQSNVGTVNWMCVFRSLGNNCNFDVILKILLIKFDKSLTILNIRITQFKNSNLWVHSQLWITPLMASFTMMAYFISFWWVKRKQKTTNRNESDAFVIVWCLGRFKFVCYDWSRFTHFSHAFRF